MKIKRLKTWILVAFLTFIAAFLWHEDVYGQKHQAIQKNFVMSGNYNLNDHSFTSTTIDANGVVSYTTEKVESIASDVGNFISSNNPFSNNNNMTVTQDGNTTTFDDGSGTIFTEKQHKINRANLRFGIELLLSPTPTRYVEIQTRLTNGKYKYFSIDASVTAKVYPMTSIGGLLELLEVCNYDEDNFLKHHWVSLGVGYDSSYPNQRILNFIPSPKNKSYTQLGAGFTFPFEPFAFEVGIGLDVKKHEGKQQHNAFASVLYTFNRAKAARY